MFILPGHHPVEPVFVAEILDARVRLKPSETI
jgi:hypothetical protein